MRPFLLLALLPAFATSAAVADDAAPGIVYAQGAKFDKSFNEAAYTGAERFKAETGVAYTRSRSPTTASGSRHCRP